MTHREFKKRKKFEGEPSLERLSGSVPQAFINATRLASKKMTDMGVRHLLVGGMAVGAHGYPRPTKDIDFFVGEEAFEHHGSIVTLRSGLPIAIGDIGVDPVSPDSKERRVLSKFFKKTSGKDVPIMPIEGLVYMKVKAGRYRDLGDVVELLKAGKIERDSIRAFLLKVGEPSLSFTFENLIKKADEE